MEYILVADGEFEEACEIELEEDQSLSLSTLTSEFGSGVTGLSYTNPETGKRRIIRLNDTVFHPPRSGWSSTTHIVTRTKTEAQLQPASPIVVKEEVGTNPKVDKDDQVTPPNLTPGPSASSGTCTSKSIPDTKCFHSHSTPQSLTLCWLVGW